MFYRFSDLFPTRERCFLTFEPDSLTVPEGVGHSYNLFFTPNNAASEMDIIAGIFHLEKIFTNFTTYSCWRPFFVLCYEL